MPVHFNDSSATSTARALFDSHAVGFMWGKIIRFKSGILSPGAYNNNRMLPSYPNSWDVVIGEMLLIATRIRRDFDMIASVATGGIAHGVALARLLGVPHVIIKKEEKTTHGLSGLIDGDAGLLVRARVLMIEDMSSTFESTLRAMKPIEACDATVTHTIAISTWGFPEFYKNVGTHDVHVLCTGEKLIEQGMAMKNISSDYADLLQAWIKNPHDERWITDAWKMP